MIAATKPATAPARYRFVHSTTAHLGHKDARGFIGTLCGRTIQPDVAIESSHRWPLCRTCENPSKAPSRAVRLPLAAIAMVAE